MKISAAMTLVLAMMWVSLAALFMTGDAACNGIRSMTWSAACLKSTSEPAMYNLCQEMLQNTPESAQVTVYATAAARVAARSFGVTASTAAELLQSKSSPLQGEEREAVKLCSERTSASQHLMLSVAVGMSTCKYQNAHDNYHSIIAALNSCEEALYRFPKSPIVAKNNDDRNANEVAFNLGALVLATT